MRLAKQEVAAIKKVIHKYDPTAKIYLFGSRVHDNLRGGDIDLLLESKIITFADKIQIKLDLYDLIGEQKIDIVLADNKSAFTKMAKTEGILL